MGHQVGSVGATCGRGGMADAPDLGSGVPGAYEFESLRPHHVHAVVAQLVERHLAKVAVDGSSPFARSMSPMP